MKFDDVVEALKSRNEERTASWDGCIARAEKWVRAYTMPYDMGYYEAHDVQQNALAALDKLGAMLTGPTFPEMKNFLGSAREAECEYARIHSAEERQAALKLYHSLRKKMVTRKLWGKLYPPELKGTFAE